MPVEGKFSVLSPGIQVSVSAFSRRSSMYCARGVFLSEELIFGYAISYPSFSAINRPSNDSKPGISGFRVVKVKVILTFF